MILLDPTWMRQAWPLPFATALWFRDASYTCMSDSTWCFYQARRLSLWQQTIVIWKCVWCKQEALHQRLAGAWRNILTYFDKLALKHATFTRRLVAAAAAYISVLMRGRVTVELKDDTVIVKPIAGDSSRSDELHSAGAISLVAKVDVGSLQSRKLAEAMMDRCILEENEAEERVLAGSKDIFLKYARCRNVYMEILQKVFAIALVSVVGSEDGVQLSVAITLLMAATSAMVQPFLQPQ
ncbi:unnamed protein product, partial [Effrenium voratum]